MEARSLSTVIMTDIVGDEVASIARRARVTHPEGLEGSLDSDTKLVGWLAREGHTSPFEGCVATFYIHTPLFVARQLTRHRTLSFNEESGRYRQLEPVFHVPTGARRQRGRVGAYTYSEAPELDDKLHRTLVASYATAWEAYQGLLDAGVANEQARAVLPMGVYTKLYATGSLLNWARFLVLRNDSHAQLEMRELALNIESNLMIYAPEALAGLLAFLGRKA